MPCGTCPEDIALRQPGAMNHYRWLTTANRILRLCIGTGNLKIIARFIMAVYAPMWFTIKSKPSSKDGSRHLCQSLQTSRYLLDDLKKIVDPVIQRNAYFAHTACILLGMLTDDRKHIRELGLRRILKARKQNTARVRRFKIPPLNLDADDYTNVIDWSELLVTEPPVTMSISDEQLQQFIQEPETPVVKFSRFPCHTQAVER